MRMETTLNPRRGRAAARRDAVRDRHRGLRRDRHRGPADARRPTHALRGIRPLRARPLRLGEGEELAPRETDLPVTLDLSTFTRSRRPLS